MSRHALLLIGAIVLVKALTFASGAISIARAPRPLPAMASGIPLVGFGSPYYLEILQTGYPTRPADGSIPAVINYFPLYPLAARLPARVASPQMALLFVANVASMFGILLAWQWARLVTSDSAFWSALLLLCFPTSMFLSAAYTEGLFLLLTAATLLLAAHGRFWAAATVCALATASRPTGVALAVMLVALYASNPSRLARAPLLAVYSLLGLLAFAAFIHTRYGGLGIYLEAQRRAVNHSDPKSSPLPANPTSDPNIESSKPTLVQLGLAKFASIGAWNKLFSWSFLIVSVIGLLGLTPIPRAYFLLPLAIFVVGYVPQNGARITQIARFETAGIPVFAALAAWLTRIGGAKLAGAACAICLMGQLMYAWAFSRGIWCG